VSSPELKQGNIDAFMCSNHPSAKCNFLLMMPAAESSEPHLQVCNHPDLFEGRSIISAYDMLPSISIQEPSDILNMRQQDLSSSICLESITPSAHQYMSAWEAAEIKV